MRAARAVGSRWAVHDVGCLGLLMYGLARFALLPAQAMVVAGRWLGLLLYEWLLGRQRVHPTPPPPAGRQAEHSDRR